VLYNEPVTTAEIVRVEPDGRAHVVAEEPARAQRYVVITADGRLVVAESFGNRITSSTSPTTGAWKRRPLITFGDLRAPQSRAAHCAGWSACRTWPRNRTARVVRDVLGNAWLDLVRGRIVDEIAPAGSVC